MTLVKRQDPTVAMSSLGKSQSRQGKGMKEWGLTVAIFMAMLMAGVSDCSFQVMGEAREW